MDDRLQYTPDKSFVFSLIYTLLYLLWTTVSLAFKSTHIHTYDFNTVFHVTEYFCILIVFWCNSSWDVGKPVGAAESIKRWAALDLNIGAWTFCGAFQFVGSRAPDGRQCPRAVYHLIREIVRDAEDSCGHGEPPSSSLVCSILLLAFLLST